MSIWTEKRTIVAYALSIIALAEIIDLTILQVSNGMERKGDSKRTSKTIEGRLDKLYAELDHREKLYNYQEERRA